MSLDSLGYLSPAAGATATPTSHPALVRRVAIGAAAALLLAGVAGTASAVETAPQETIANVVVNSVITLTGLTEEFTLTGAPGDTVTTGDTDPITQSGPVTMTVTTNNQLGYTVTVQADGDLIGADPTNINHIPISDLTLEDSSPEGTSGYVAMSDTEPVTVHSKASRSELTGDPITNNFQILIPDVNSDTYTATLSYVATTL